MAKTCCSCLRAGLRRTRHNRAPYLLEGIWTRQLANTGLQTIGIEPNPDMAHTAREEGRREPTFEVREARAEASGLHARSVDLVWNLRDLEDPFTREYERIMNTATKSMRKMKALVNEGNCI